MADADKFMIFGKDGSRFSGTMEEVADSICARLGLPKDSIVLTTQANAGGATGHVLGSIGVMKTSNTAADLPFYGPERPPTGLVATKKAANKK